ncbi:vanadium-dependent haloperoxidase [Methylicorpusculum oleiharenae]|uniref:vanadium-dependent haloperoxidase n=1 Tax=Methylicorpusculum oleiharenae TaxID=1338687 RepID=UPI001359B6F0|nr:vanadium-dependent haloperoxidase [Methylicorpusculum oleiharenae]MCD2452547.1 vanadium-dependent haloperoxidase [Methylicorpusculum oleiharenae]
MKKTILISTIATILTTPVFADELDPLPATERKKLAYEYREHRANMNFLNSSAPHPTNGDESAVPNYSGQFHKSLPHNNNGMVAPLAYGKLLEAIQTGTFEAFEQIPAGGPVKLANPLAAQVYDLEGRDSHDYGIKPPPSLSSAETGAEMIEVYGQALLRDIPFSDYVGNAHIRAVATELAGLTDFHGPTSPATLFRGVFEGDQDGPYLSQFLYKDIPAGPKVVDQKYTGYASGQNFMTSYNEWLAIENGQNPIATVTAGPSRYIITGRDLASYVHRDFTYQAYHNAALILLSWGPSAWDDGNPYKTATRQGAFIDMGAGEILDTVARAGNAALRAAWFQKWNVHRRLRPEEYGGLAQNNPGLLHTQFTSSPVLMKVQAKYGSSLLPLAYPEGAPTHPAYPAGHATISGACATVLKAFFKDDAAIPSPVQPSANGKSLEAIGDVLTIGGELNKLASNITLGRDWAGVHYRSDGTEGMLLGEEIGIAILKDWRDAHPKQPTLTLIKFNGDEIQI